MKAELKEAGFVDYKTILDEIFNTKPLPGKGKLKQYKPLWRLGKLGYNAGIKIVKEFGKVEVCIACKRIP